MTHYRRDHAPGLPHHVICRLAVTGDELPIETDRQRANYLLRVGATTKRTDWVPLAYAVMGNHIHWVLVGGHEPLERFTRPINTGFALWYNAEHRRRGPLFAKRPTSYAKWWEEVFDAIAYVHNNPVRAGVFDHAGESTWTSHRAFIGAEQAPPWLDVDRTLRLCGFPSTAAGREAFHEQVRARGNDARDPVLSGRVSDDARTKIRGVLRAPVELCTPRQSDGGPSHAVVLPGESPINPRWPVAPSDVVDAAARALELDPAEVRGPSRQRCLVNGRRLAVLVGTRYLGLTFTELGAAVGISASAAVHLLNRRPDAVRALEARAGSLARAIRGAVESVAEEQGGKRAQGPRRAVA